MPVVHLTLIQLPEKSPTTDHWYVYLCIYLFIYYCCYILAASTVGDARYGISEVISSLYAVNCNSSHTNISQCPFVRKASGCRINVAKCTTEWGLRCHSE